MTILEFIDQASLQDLLIMHLAGMGSFLALYAVFYGIPSQIINFIKSKSRKENKE